VQSFDPDTGEVVPRGVVGQVKVRGPALMKAYLGRPPGSGFDDETVGRWASGHVEERTPTAAERT
jgi:acyl-CoA synthetase (AMP-forming)/AMP-acid ligase II